MGEEDSMNVFLRYAINKIVGPKKVCEPGETRVMSMALKQHFLQTHEPHAYYSLPIVAGPVASRMDDFFSRPMTTALESTIHPEDPAEQQMCVYASEKRELVFQVGVADLGSKKTVKVESMRTFGSTTPHSHLHL